MPTRKNSSYTSSFTSYSNTNNNNRDNNVNDASFNSQSSGGGGLVNEYRKAKRIFSRRLSRNNNSSSRSTLSHHRNSTTTNNTSSVDNIETRFIVVDDEDENDVITEQFLNSNVFDDRKLLTIESQLKEEIRTAGMRRARENAILATVDMFIAERERMVNAYRRAEREWGLRETSSKERVGNQIRSLDRRIEDLGLRKNEVEEQNKACEERITSLCAELDSTRFELQQAKEDVSSFKSSSFEKLMDIQSKHDDAIHTKLKEIDLNYNECVISRVEQACQSLEVEHASKITSMEEALKNLEKENQSLKMDLSKAEIEIKQLREVAANSESKTLEEVKAVEERHIDSNNELNRAKSIIDKLRNEKGKLADELKKKSHSLDSFNQRRMKELEAVESRVKRILAAKDKEIAEAQNLANNMKKRAREAEHAIQELEAGFEEVSP